MSYDWHVYFIQWQLNVAIFQGRLDFEISSAHQLGNLRVKNPRPVHAQGITRQFSFSDLVQAMLFENCCHELMGILLMCNLCWWQARQGHRFQIMALLMKQTRKLAGQDHWQSHDNLPASIFFRNINEAFLLLPLHLIQCCVFQCWRLEPFTLMIQISSVCHIDDTYLNLEKRIWKRESCLSCSVLKIIALQYCLSQLQGEAAFSCPVIYYHQTRLHKKSR